MKRIQNNRVKGTVLAVSVAASLLSGCSGQSSTPYASYLLTCDRQESTLSKTVRLHDPPAQWGTSKEGPSGEKADTSSVWVNGYLKSDQQMQSISDILCSNIESTNEYKVASFNGTLVASRKADGILPDISKKKRNGIGEVLFNETSQELEMKLGTKIEGTYLQDLVETLSPLQVKREVNTSPPSRAAYQIDCQEEEIINKESPKELNGWGTVAESPDGKPIPDDQREQTVWVNGLTTDSGQEQAESTLVKTICGDDQSEPFIDGSNTEYRYDLSWQDNVLMVEDKKVDTFFARMGRIGSFTGENVSINTASKLTPSELKDLGDIVVINKAVGIRER
ncbi:hypothetical protein SAMN05444392_10426 [Seinonella peptonophila]|uniref:Lipoprotein n=1 Tax=Seinonella peptonophila TaxID=112248 RepID=A0A1M4WXZ6_9BACL|nr:hypothetical protein [Seinonella peptonophila]SHE86106.1 hypothetical protein SAMN05444392_10426 [Seinonella peptonophila]